MATSRLTGKTRFGNPEVDRRTSFGDFEVDRGA